MGWPLSFYFLAINYWKRIQACWKPTDSRIQNSFKLLGVKIWSRNSLLWNLKVLTCIYRILSLGVILSHSEVQESKYVWNRVKTQKFMANERTRISGSSNECLLIFTWPVCHIPDHILRVITEIPQRKEKERNVIIFLFSPQLLAKIKWLQP